MSKWSRKKAKAIRGPSLDLMVLDEVAGFFNPSALKAQTGAYIKTSGWTTLGWTDDKGVTLAGADPAISTEPITMTMTWDEMPAEMIAALTGQETIMAVPSVKWYEALADVVATTVLDPYERREVAHRMALVLAEVPKFNRQRFLAACAPEDIPQVTAHVLADRRRIIDALAAISPGELDLGGVIYLQTRTIDIINDDDIVFVRDEDL